MSKEDFKNFVKDNPNLIKYVNDNTMTWQKFYDMYELYGSNHDIWNNYSNKIKEASTNNDNSIKEVINMVKSVNLEKVQKGIDSLQKTISLVQDISGKSTISTEYEKTPIYKRFED